MLWAEGCWRVVPKWGAVKGAWGVPPPKRKAVAGPTDEQGPAPSRNVASSTTRFKLFVTTNGIFGQGSSSRGSPSKEVTFHVFINSLAKKSTQAPVNQFKVRKTLTASLIQKFKQFFLPLTFLSTLTSTVKRTAP